MASFDNTMTYFDFNDIENEMYQNDPPLSISGIQFSTALDDSPLFEPTDAHSLYEGNEAMGLKSHRASHGSLSPSTNSCISDDMPATPLSYGAETAELEINPTEFIQRQGYYELLDQIEGESGSLSGGHAVVQGEQINNGSAPVQPTSHMVSSNTNVVSSTSLAGQEQTLQAKTINAVDVMSTHPSSSTRPTLPVATGSSNARQDMNFLAKSDAVRVGVKRKTDQGKEKAKKVMKRCEDSPISRNQKNAIAARENRLKKKMEFEDLKRNEALLEEENQCLRKENSDHLKTIQELEQKVEYYKSVLYNQSALSTVLQSLKPQPKLKLSSSMNGPNVDRSTSMSGGVCLHINGTDASLECCSKCSIKAQDSFNS